MSVSLLILVLVAPLPYWLLGLPWVLGGRRVALAPLIGCAVAGLSAEFAMILGLPVKLCTVALLACSLGVVALRWRQLTAARPDFLEWLPFYGVSVLIASISPFPVLGSWSGDWLLYYKMGQAVSVGPLPTEMLARPPAFGAAAMPLWLVAEGLAPYQIMAAVASAATLSCVLQAMRFVQPKARPLWLLPLVLSPFFLHNTAAAWSKLLVGAFVLQAGVEAFRASRWASALFFGIAIAIHEGFVIWAPCVLLCHLRRPFRLGELVKSAFAMGVCGVLFAAPLLMWILANYGLQAKVTANPAVTDAIPQPLYWKAIEGTLEAFVAWGNIETIARWMSHPNPLEVGVAAKESYWLITGWITGLAATMFGLLWPFLLLGKQLRTPRWADHVEWKGLWVIVGLPIAILLNATVAGFNSTHGVLQAGLSSLGLGGYAFCAAHVFADAARERRALRIVSWGTAIVGTLPWLLLNGFMTAGLVLSERLRQRLRDGSEGDYFHVIDNHLEPLGLHGFPTVPLVIAGLFVAGWVLWTRASDKPATPGADLLTSSGGT